VATVQFRLSLQENDGLQHHPYKIEINKGDNEPANFEFVQHSRSSKD
jgi:hypothetical protein